MRIFVTGLFTAAMLFIASESLAQVTHSIHLNDGNVVTNAVPMIDSIYFGSEGEPQMHLKLINGTSDSYHLSHINEVLFGGEACILDGGAITANDPTSIGGGGSVSFTVEGAIGPNQAWVLLNEEASQILETNTTGSFSFPGNNSYGNYRVVHAAYGQGMSLMDVDPQNLPACIAVSNSIGIQVKCPSSVTFNYKGPLPETYGTVISAGRCWLDRNLGASFSVTGIHPNGDLFQWGRGNDGHQDFDFIQDFFSPVFDTTLSSVDQPSHGAFILALNYPHDWRSPQNDDLWQGVDGTNNPCPEGWRIPTEDEWNDERLSWSSNDRSGAQASPLKLPADGGRVLTGWNPYDNNIAGLYWSSTVSGVMARRLYFNNNNAVIGSNYRGYGYSVRCIKD